MSEVPSCCFWCDILNLFALLLMDKSEFICMLITNMGDEIENSEFGMQNSEFRCPLWGRIRIVCRIKSNCIIKIMNSFTWQHLTSHTIISTAKQ